MQVPEASAVSRRIRRVALGDIVHRTAVKYGDRTAGVDGEQRLSYRELDILSSQFAHYLLDAHGSGIQVASYATEVTGPEVLDAVQQALPSSYAVVREDQGMGEQLDGSGDGVSFRVTVREGAYDVMFSEE